jgi:hypothetical protein
MLQQPLPHRIGIGRMVVVKADTNDAGFDLSYALSVETGIIDSLEHFVEGLLASTKSQLGPVGNQRHGTSFHTFDAGDRASGDDGSNENEHSLT